MSKAKIINQCRDCPNRATCWISQPGGHISHDCPLADWPRVSMKILEEIIALDDREKLWTELRSKGIEIEE